MSANLKPLFGVEYEAKIAECYSRNIGEHIIVAPVQDVDYSSLETPYWLHMSPPCTNASVANNSGGETELDIELAQACIRALKTLRPPMVSLENVLGYRKFKSFKMICRALANEGYAINSWPLLSADYGVPQTRLRLFLVASRIHKPHKPASTHQEKRPETGQLSFLGDDIPEQLPSWVGWLEAIEDLLPSLPDSHFAKWQVPLLPAELRTMLIANGKYDEKLVTVNAGSSAFTVTANSNQGGIRGILVRGDNDGQKRGKGHRVDVEPSQTIGANGATPRAFLVDGTTNDHGTTLTCLDCQTPCLTIKASSYKSIPKAYTQGRVVKMTPRALARFQSVPDWYVLPERNSLSCTIIGNGVPSLMMQRLIEANL